MLYEKLLVLPCVRETLARQFSANAPGREVCGILCGCVDNSSGIATHVRPIRNISPLAHGFCVSASDYRQACRAAVEADEKALAFYHSHRGTVTPTLRDRDLPIVTGIPALIFTVDGGRIWLYCFTVVKTYGGIREIPCRVVRD